jgi:hypothetical protein
MTYRGEWHGIQIITDNDRHKHSGKGMVDVEFVPSDKRERELFDDSICQLHGVRYNANVIIMKNQFIHEADNYAKKEAQDLEFGEHY